MFLFLYLFFLSFILFRFFLTVRRYWEHLRFEGPVKFFAVRKHELLASYTFLCGRTSYRTQHYISPYMRYKYKPIICRLARVISYWKFNAKLTFFESLNTSTFPCVHRDTELVPLVVG